MKNLKIYFSLSLVIFSMVSVAAFAQEDKVIQEEDKVVYQKKTVMDFSDVNVSGDLQKPDGSYTKVRGKTKFRNLIELRGNFRPEMRRSVNAL